MGLRHFHRCRGCLSVVAVESRLPDGAVCGACGYGFRYMGQTERDRLVRHEERCACDGRCTGATGPKCDCSCGGVNHGSGRTVTVTIDAGGIPRVSSLDPEESKRIADEWTTARKPFREELARLRDSGYLPRVEWERMRDLECCLSSASKKTSHKGRLKVLAECTFLLHSSQTR